LSDRPFSYKKKGYVIIFSGYNILLGVMKEGNRY